MAAGGGGADDAQRHQHRPHRGPPSALVVQYFGGVKWTDRAPALVRRWSILRENSGKDHRRRPPFGRDDGRLCPHLRTARVRGGRGRGRIDLRRGAPGAQAGAPVEQARSSPRPPPRPTSRRRAIRCQTSSRPSTRRSARCSSTVTWVLNEGMTDLPLHRGIGAGAARSCGNASSCLMAALRRPSSIAAIVKLDGRSSQP